MRLFDLDIANSSCRALTSFVKTQPSSRGSLSCLCEMKYGASPVDCTASHLPCHWTRARSTSGARMSSYAVFFLGTTGYQLVAWGSVEAQLNNNRKQELCARDFAAHSTRRVCKFDVAVCGGRSRSAERWDCFAPDFMSGFRKIYLCLVDSS